LDALAVCEAFGLLVDLGVDLAEWVFIVRFQEK